MMVIMIKVSVKLLDWQKLAGFRFSYVQTQSHYITTLYCMYLFKLLTEITAINRYIYNIISTLSIPSEYIKYTD